MMCKLRMCIYLYLASWSCNPESHSTSVISSKQNAQQLARAKATITCGSKGTQGSGQVVAGMQDSHQGDCPAAIHIETCIMRETCILHDIKALFNAICCQKLLLQPAG